jgi:hypothetical protein
LEPGPFFLVELGEIKDIVKISPCLPLVCRFQQALGNAHLSLVARCLTAGLWEIKYTEKSEK